MALKCLFEKSKYLARKHQLLSVYIQQNGMSQYPDYYVAPIYRKEKQKELAETGELQQYAHIPTKAALVDQTSSVYHDGLVSLFTNYVMRDGEKAVARSIVEKSFEKIKRIQLEKYHKATEEEKSSIELNPKVIFHTAVQNCKPILQLTPIKRGGVRYQVPVPITDRKAQFMSMKWIIEAANEKDKWVQFAEKLAYELLEASKNQGKIVKKKQDLHRQCEANRAYAHYRWS